MTGSFKKKEILDDEDIENEEFQNSTADLSTGDVIDNFVHRILDTEECAKNFIQIAGKNYIERADKLKNDISEHLTALELNDTEKSKKIIALKNLRKAIREIDRHNRSSPVATLEKSLFVSLFSAFDKYVGDLVSILYNANPDLYKNINREIPLSEALTYESIEALRDVMLNKEIESLRRKNYQDQVKDIEKKFSINLDKYNKWPDFIEMAQRRNLFTHCDGIISKQYIDVCKSNGYVFKDEPIVGEQLDIGAKYFYKSCLLITEIGVMLGQTLWRKVIPNDLSNADTQLNNLIFDFLHNESWAKAISLSKFALNLPNISNDQMERIFTVNYAIALKAINQNDQSTKILDKRDWSATSNEFKLAYNVLNGDFDTAKDLMIKVGKDSEMIPEIAYLDWPLFRDFRDSQDFFDAYEAVFEYKYSTKLKSLADEKQAGVVG